MGHAARRVPSLSATSNTGKLREHDSKRCQRSQVSWKYVKGLFISRSNVNAVVCRIRYRPSAHSCELAGLLEKPCQAGFFKIFFAAGVVKLGVLLQRTPRLLYTQFRNWLLFCTGC